MTPASLRSGAFLIDKPEGLTSSDVVTRLKVALVKAGYAPKGFKIGHGGTLDPFATGVLAVLTGEATKLADCYLHSVKSYEGLIRLGTATDTGDPTGEVTNSMPVPPLSPTDWRSLTRRFVEETYWQTPPMYSSKKIGGRSLHSLARKGEVVEREAILKRIECFEVTPDGTEFLRFEVRCESGTYVRVLAEDLAKSAGTVAHLEALRRTASSDLALSKAGTLDGTLKSIGEKLPLESLSHFIPLSDLASHLPRIPLHPEQADRLRNGVVAEVRSLTLRADALDSPARFMIATVISEPVALLERSGPEEPFRLQRIFHGQNP